MQRTSPEASSGLRMFDASSEPPVTEPAPTTVWISSMNRIASPCRSRAPMTRFRRSSKSPAEPGAREQRAHVQRVDAVPAQGLRHLPVGDELGEALGDRGLAHPRLAHVDGVVLQPAAEHLDRALEDVVAADERVDLPVARLLRELRGERGERLRVRPPVRCRPAPGSLRLLRRRLAARVRLSGPRPRPRHPRPPSAASSPGRHRGVPCET